jgi:hypothetical protein
MLWPARTCRAAGAATLSICGLPGRLVADEGKADPLAGCAATAT